MEDFQLLIDLHKHNTRQGPGSEETTLRAIELTGLRGKSNLRIADIGCGTGGQTLVLGRELGGRITAVDLSPDFLTMLNKRTSEAGLSKIIRSMESSMENLPFEHEELDLIWSEGAVYSMGFENGIKYWRKFIKPGGILALSEISWTSTERPKEIENYWETYYPEIGTTNEKLAILEKQGYRNIAHFVLPETDWIDQYYRPLDGAHNAFLERQINSPEAEELVRAEREEFAYYLKYKKFYSYGFYIAEKN